MVAPAARRTSGSPPLFSRSCERRRSKIYSDNVPEHAGLEVAREKPRVEKKAESTRDAYFSTTVPISMQVFSAALRYSGSGWATLTKSAC